MITISFLRSSSQAYPGALSLARKAAYYQEAPEGRRVRHEASYTARFADLADAAELWDLVRYWKGTRFLVAGQPMLGGEGSWQISEVLRCAARAGTFTPPQRYCRSAPASPRPAWPGRPPLPCRLAATRLAWELDAIEWHQPLRRMDQLRALLLERGLAWCPFAQVGPFEEALAAWRADRAAWSPGGLMMDAPAHEAEGGPP